MSENNLNEKFSDCQWWFKRKQSESKERKNMKKNNQIFGVVLIDLLVDFGVFQSDYIKISGFYFY